MRVPPLSMRIMYTVRTGDGKIVGIFQTKSNAEDFIKAQNSNFAKNLTIHEICTDFHID